MFGRRSWFSGWSNKSKNPHSTEHLKHLYAVLSKNQVVTEQNKDLLVETLRGISETLIWGDQNDGSVFEFFLEKNIISHFVRIIRQKQGRFVCTQLLQTLNILFENIREDTSLFYLLSNNHVNLIIQHRFDFNDEEVMAYYISFIKTLSLKLEVHTIHFFYIESTKEFPLYTEAIKFFKHPESMVRIAVRTLTLNVFRVNDRAMREFICERTAHQYFSNLVWFIGKNVLELDACAANTDHQMQARLADLVAEHLDHLHYLNDILCLNIEPLNEILTDHLLNRLFLPLYIYSLADQPDSPRTSPHVSRIVALFLLNQVFLIMSHKPLVRQLADIIFNGTLDLFDPSKNTTAFRPEFIPPEEPLELSLQASRSPSGSEGEPEADIGTAMTRLRNNTARSDDVEIAEETVRLNSGSNITDEEKIRQQGIPMEVGVEQSERIGPADPSIDPSQLSSQAQSTMDEDAGDGEEFDMSQKHFFRPIMDSLSVESSDHAALFALGLLYALGHNNGINQDLLDEVLLTSDRSTSKSDYNNMLMGHLMRIIRFSCAYGSKVRLATLEMAILLIKQLAVPSDGTTVSCLRDSHLQLVKRARDESALLLEGFLKSEEIFLDMFEEEYEQMKGINVEYLMMDGNLLLPPIGTPMSGMDFHKRLPCGEVERAMRAIRAFFLIRHLCLVIRGEPETELPLTKESEVVKVNQILDLTHNELVGCNVITKDGTKVKRYMVIDETQIILVKPEGSRLGHGVVQLAGLLQNIEVSGDPNECHALNITIQKSGSKKPLPMAMNSKVISKRNRTPLLAAKFIFDDYIRCMAAKQKLTKGRLRARQKKMHQIAKLLDMNISSSSPLTLPIGSGFSSNGHRRLCRSTSSESSRRAPQAEPYSIYDAQKAFGSQRLMEIAVRPRIPGGAVPAAFVTRDKKQRLTSAPVDIKDQRRKPRSLSRSREASPRPLSLADEEIPMEDLSGHSTPKFSLASGSPLGSPTKSKCRMNGTFSPTDCADVCEEDTDESYATPQQASSPKNLCETSLDAELSRKRAEQRSAKGQIHDV